jgi:hypothetical protein
LTGCVPYLSFDGFPIHLDAASGKLYANCRLGFEQKLVASETRKQIGLANTRVPNEHHLEQIVVAASIAEECQGT